MLDKRRALLDPSEVFATPEEVRDSRELTTDEKIEILKRWAYDDSEITVAVEEGMPAGEERDGLQRRILLALGALGALGVSVDLEHTGPSKQHGITDRRH